MSIFGLFWWATFLVISVLLQVAAARLPIGKGEMRGRRGWQRMLAAREKYQSNTEYAFRICNFTFLLTGFIQAVFWLSIILSGGLTDGFPQYYGLFSMLSATCVGLTVLEAGICYNDLKTALIAATLSGRMRREVEEENEALSSILNSVRMWVTTLRVVSIVGLHGLAFAVMIAMESQ